MKSDDQVDHFVSGGRVGGNRGRIFGLAVAEGIQTDVDRRAGRVLYGIIPTLQSFPNFGRVYAAYGGIFIILAVFWGWFVDRKTPDL